MTSLKLNLGNTFVRRKNIREVGRKDELIVMAMSRRGKTFD